MWVVESPMEASNGSAFLPLLVVLELLGLKISWFPIRIGETDVATHVGLPQLDLDLVLEEEASLGVARSLFVPITFSVVRKRRVPSFAFVCGRDIWHGFKLSCVTFTLTVTSGVMGLMKVWMAWLMNNGYNFRVEILLVVQVAENPNCLGARQLGITV